MVRFTKAIQEFRTIALPNGMPNDGSHDRGHSDDGPQPQKDAGTISLLIGHGKEHHIGRYRLYDGLSK